MDKFKCDLVFRWVSPTEKLRDRSVRRIRDNDELRYCLRSWAGMKFVRQVHIIGKGPPPSWINHRHVRWHKERELTTKFLASRDLAYLVPNVYNSEPAKLLIRQIEGLHRTFIVLDDENFAYPGPMPIKIMFIRPRLPVHPENVVNCHQPIPFFRRQYFKYVDEIPKGEIARMFSSGRDRIDPFPAMSDALRKAGKVAVRSAPRLSVEYWDTHCFVPSLSLTDIKKYRQWSIFMSPGEGKQVVERPELFFKAVKKIKPLFFTVNDNWTVDNTTYVKHMQLFHTFLRDLYPTKSKYEL